MSREGSEAWVAPVGFSGGAPVGSAAFVALFAASVLTGSAAVLFASSATGSRPLHATTATIRAQLTMGAIARSMQGSTLKTANLLQIQ